MEQNYNRLVAQIFGAVLVLVGLLGFVNDPVLGIFETSLLHNLIHLLSGAVLLAGAFMDNGRNARMINLTLGIVYLLVTAIGFVAPGVLEALGVEINMADNVLHLLLGVVLTGVALMGRNTHTTTSPTTRL